LDYQNLRPRMRSVLFEIDSLGKAVPNELAKAGIRNH
jgi:hypothetical protein